MRPFLLALSVLLLTAACSAPRGRGLAMAPAAHASERPPRNIPTVVELPPLGARGGCHYKGRMAGPTALSLAPRDATGDFAVVTGVAAEVVFGAAPDDAASVSLDMEGYELRAYARADAVAVFPQKRLQYQRVFEPHGFEPLEAHAVADGTLRIEPRGWHTHVTARFVEDTPWVVPCVSVGLDHGAYEVPEPRPPVHVSPLGPTLSLSATPGGPVVAELPSRAILSPLRQQSGSAFVFWNAPEGIYRGWVKASEVAEAGGRFGHGVGTGSSRASTRCEHDVPLYLLHDSGRAVRLGRVRAGSSLGLAEAGEPAGTVLVGAARTELVPIDPPPGIAPYPAYTLAIAQGSCGDGPNAPKPRAP